MKLTWSRYQREAGGVSGWVATIPDSDYEERPSTSGQSWLLGPGGLQPLDLQQMVLTRVGPIKLLLALQLPENFPRHWLLLRVRRGVPTDQLGQYGTLKAGKAAALNEARRWDAERRLKSCP